MLMSGKQTVLAQGGKPNQSILADFGEFVDHIHSQLGYLEEKFLLIPGKLPANRVFCWVLIHVPEIGSEEYKKCGELTPARKYGFEL